FVNSLAMRVKVDEEASFSDLLMEVRRMTLDAYHHQDMPFERLVEELAPLRSLSSTPIFQVMFALQNAPPGTQQLESLRIEPVGPKQFQVRFDLEVHAFEEDGELWIHWMYNRDLFEARRMEQMAAHYERLLAAVVAAPAQKIFRLKMLSVQEKQRLLQVNEPKVGERMKSNPAGLSREHLEHDSDETAMILGDQRLSYRELNARVDQLTRQLNELGIGPEKLAGVS